MMEYILEKNNTEVLGTLMVLFPFLSQDLHSLGLEL